MNNSLLADLECSFKKCSNCLLHSDYISLLNKMYDIELSQEHIDFLCNKVMSKDQIWEIRFEHLRILLLNPSASSYDLKQFYLENLKKCRRITMKLFFIRGYAIYASEEEIETVIDKFEKCLEKNHDYIDYNCILSVAGIPYLVDTYGYECFVRTLEKAEEEYQRIDPLLRGFFTLNSNLEQIDLLSTDEVQTNLQLFLRKRGV